MKFERAHGRRPVGVTVVCELECIVAIREARESDLRDPDHRLLLTQAAARDGATMDEVEAAKRANGTWPA
jgi:hypothetical protein